MIGLGILNLKVLCPMASVIMDGPESLEASLWLPLNYVRQWSIVQRPTLDVKLHGCVGFPPTTLIFCLDHGSQLFVVWIGGIDVLHPLRVQVNTIFGACESEELAVGVETFHNGWM